MTALILTTAVAVASFSAFWIGRWHERDRRES